MTRFSLLLVLGMFPLALRAQTKEVPADDPSIEYVGRFDFTNAKQPAFMYSGSTIRVGFTGTSISVKLADDSLRNWYNVKLDDSLFRFKTDNSKGIYHLAHGLPEGKHTLEISRRTEWHGGNTRFGGFVIDSGAKTFALQRLKRTIEFIGNSVTCGYGIEGKSRDEHFNYATQNSDLTFAALVARAVKANYVAICRSGIGMAQSYGGDSAFSQPKLYDEVVVGSEARWDYKKNQPDAVVIELGSNDLVKPVDSTAFANEYTGFVRKLRAQYPHARIVCAAGPDAPGDTKSKFQSYVKAIVDHFEGIDRHVYYFSFGEVDTNGSDWHQNLQEHEQMANVLLPFIKKIMRWM